MHVRGNQITDTLGTILLLRGAQISGLNVADPGDDAMQNLQAMNALTFGTIRQVWNMNAVRLPVASWIWERDGQSYLDLVGGIVKLANDAGLMVVLAEYEDSRGGAPTSTGLPSQEVAAFWQAWAAYFSDNPAVIFDVYNQPSAANIPGHSSGRQSTADWQFWLHGGSATDGNTVVGMQDLVNAIRSTGAQQLIAVEAFSDGLDFQGLTSAAYVNDPNILYEVHPFYNDALTNQDRDTNFGFLATRFPVYAGEWGVSFDTNQPSCQKFPQDPQGAATLLLQTLSYFDSHQVSWTAAGFEPSRLIQDFTTYVPTMLDQPWSCGQVSTPEPGIGQTLILWLTGDPFGFGTAELITNISGGPLSPTGLAAPGEMIAISRQQMGPYNPAYATLDDSGNLPTFLGDTQVLFDGVPAPLLIVSFLGINVQVPYELAGHQSTVVQIVYLGIPCSKTTLQLLPAVPSILESNFTTTAAAQNQDGSANSSANPAAAGSMISLTATGVGPLAPPRITGATAQPPYSAPVLPLSLTVAGVAAEVLTLERSAGQRGDGEHHRAPAGVAAFARPGSASLPPRPQRRRPARPSDGCRALDPLTGPLPPRRRNSQCITSLQPSAAFVPRSLRNR